MLPFTSPKGETLEGLKQERAGSEVARLGNADSLSGHLEHTVDCLECQDICD